VDQTGNQAANLRGVRIGAGFTVGGMRIRFIDAFTDRPFAGNPAGVCVLDADDWPDEGWMRRVAAEVDLPAMAFAHPLSGDGQSDWALRWFTSVAELELCGHGTLAVAHALRSDGRMSGRIRFSVRSGVLIADSDDDSAITLDLPSAPPTEITAPDGLAAALGDEPVATYATGALRDLLATFGTEDIVRRLAPDFTEVAELTRRNGIRGIIATAAAARGTGYDFVSRFFAPSVGISEDPVTGSAHTALGPYWSTRLGQDHLTGLQASARTGLVRTAVHGERVHLTGRAVTVFDGTLLH
jgi:PhzF family phenazine biosynthesis protein